MATGLVLEGGAMRGMFTAGVMDVLMENHIHFDGVIGVSAGAVFGCNYKSEQIGRVLRYNRRYCNDKRYGSWRSLAKSGDFYNVDFCYRQVPEIYDPFDKETYENNPTQFYIVATNVKNGKAEYHHCVNNYNKDVIWMQASASMPLMSRIVKIEDKMLLDGGVADSIPLRYFESQGYDKNLVILTQPKSYRKKKNNLLPILRKRYKNYPEFIKALEVRHHDYNETVKYVQAQRRRKKAFVIQPPCDLKIGPVEHDKKELKRVYDLGREEAWKHLEDLKEFLK